MLRIISFILLSSLAVQAMDHLEKEPETLVQMRMRANRIIYGNIGKPENQAEGIQLYRDLIDKNDEFAAQYLAIHYQDMDIFPHLKDEERLKETVSVLLSGADKGNANAIFTLSTLNKKNNFSLISVQKMIDYLKIGEEAKNDNCLCLLGQFYRDKEFCNQWDIPYDPRLAANAFYRSFLNHSAVGTYFLSEMYLSDELGAPDFVQAYAFLHIHIKEGDNRCRVLWEREKERIPYRNFIKLVEKQWASKDDDANYYIAKGYLKGRYGLKVNIEKAEAYLKQGITKESPVKSLYLLTKLYMDKKLGLYNYKMAVQLHDQLLKIRTYLARYYHLKLISPTKASLVLEALNGSHEKRDMCSNYYCGRFWSGTIQASKDYVVNPKIAKQYLHIALRLSYAPAFCFMGEAYTFGYLGEINHHKAKIYLQKAVQLNSYKAKVMVSNYKGLLTNTDYNNFLMRRHKKDIPALREILLNYN